jgi:cysteinyl-tRNA synthetase
VTLKVYNSLTKGKEEFRPIQPHKVKIYVCGVTPYNHPHIGNARPFVTWDVIRRWLEHEGYQVEHIQNFTDIDDKIIQTAHSQGVTWDVVANEYMESYFTVMDQLNVRRADQYPRVSQHIPEIVQMVEQLIAKGFAYELAGDVYFKVDQFAGYGKLSGRDLEDMKAGARVEVDSRKAHPMDFALWKAAKPGEPAWDSPWGLGRPGWHIECSAMSLKYLGNSFDFHGGGSDLIFPHHENEIAQSEAFTGQQPFVRYWLHNGFITVNEEKMSKSLGNFFLVKDILAHFPGEVVRFFLLATHYRSQLNFSDELLQEAARGLDKLRNALGNCQHLGTLTLVEGHSSQAGELLQAAYQTRDAFARAMNDDFNTALAISELFALTKEMNTYYSGVITSKIPHCPEILATVLLVYSSMADVLGILVRERIGAVPVSFGIGAAVSAEEQTENEAKLLEIMLQLRQDARSRKDWASSDQIRDKLGELGYVIEDSPQGARWKKV